MSLTLATQPRCITFNVFNIFSDTQMPLFIDITPAAPADAALSASFHFLIRRYYGGCRRFAAAL